MKLARRLTVSLVVGILLVVGIYDVQEIGEQVDALEVQLSDDLRHTALGIGITVDELAAPGGEQRVSRYLTERGRGAPVHVRLLSLEDAERRAPGLSAEQLDKLRAHRPIEVVEHPGTRDERIVAYDFAPSSGGRIIEVSAPVSAVRRQEARLRLRLLMKSAIIVFFSGLYALLIGVRWVGHPIQRLVDQARRIGAGDLSARVTAHRGDEIGMLAHELNQMCDELDAARHRLMTETTARLSALEQLRHADRLKTVGQLASGIAHELGTPLNVVSGHAKIIIEESATQSPEDRTASARVIVEQTARITAIVRQLLDFARRGTPPLEVGELGEVASRAVRLLERECQRNKVSLTLRASPLPLRVKMDQNQVQQVMTNLIWNAMHAMPSGGKIELELSAVRATPPGGTEGDYARLVVRDQGLGIDPDDLPHIFEPFFTTKGIGQGTGLGLSVAYGIVNEHGGWIEVESQVGAGTVFSVLLPRLEVAQA